MRIKILLPIFLILSFIALMLPIIFYSQLPDTVASHFNAYGEADSWSSKDSFITFQILITFLMILLFGLLALMIPKMPQSLINLPNKKYWLNKENREQTFETVRSNLLLLGSITICFLILIFYESLTANISGTNKMSGAFWIYFSVFFTAMLFFSIRLALRFSRKNIPPKENK